MPPEIASVGSARTLADRKTSGAMPASGRSTRSEEADGRTPRSLHRPRLRYAVDVALDSVTLELDESARLITYEEYHPFGSAALRLDGATSGFSTKRFRFSAKERDDERGSIILARVTSPLGWGDGSLQIPYIVSQIPTSFFKRPLWLRGLRQFVCGALQRPINMRDPTGNDSWGPYDDVSKESRNRWLIESAAKILNGLGLPTQVFALGLRQANTVSFSATILPASYNTLFRGLNLTPKVQRSITNFIAGDSQFLGSAAMLTLVHEATHAAVHRLRQSSPEFEAAFQDAVRVYATKSLQTGERVSDPERIAEEAAAEFVADRIIAAARVLRWSHIIEDLNPDQQREAKAMAIPAYE
jgi:hypothetical protein